MGKSEDAKLYICSNFHFHCQIGGREIGLFLYSLREIMSGEELRYNYNSGAQSVSTLDWQPSLSAFCSMPEISSFLVDIKIEKIRRMSSQCLAKCLDLITARVPGRLIVMSLQDCEHISAFTDRGGLHRFRDLLWMFTVC